VGSGLAEKRLGGKEKGGCNARKHFEKSPRRSDAERGSVPRRLVPDLGGARRHTAGDREADWDQFYLNLEGIKRKAKEGDAR